MFGVSRQTLERLRKEYPSGTRVELIRLDDPYRKIPSGTIGTVEFVDDAGQLHTVWDGHGSLAMIGLSKLMLSNSNVLVIDDSINHLGLESITSVNKGLEKFSGVMLFSSHDHEMI